MIHFFVILFFVLHLSVLFQFSTVSGKKEDEEATFDYGYGSFVADPEETKKYEFLDTCSIFIAPSKRLSPSASTSHGLYAGHGFKKSHGVSLRYPAGRFPMLDRISEPEGADGIYRILSLGPNALLPKPTNCIVSSSSASSSSSSTPLSLRYTDRRVGSQRYLDNVILPQVRIYQTLSARTKYPDFDYINTSAVEVGQELVAGVSVCDASSSSGKTAPADNNSNAQSFYELEDLLTTGICLDNIEVKPSHAHMAGLGVFATRNLRAGEIVAVTPVALLPMREVYQASDDTCVLVNYCLGHSRSEVALLPLGSVAFLNHGVENVEYAWHWWGGVATAADTAVLKMSPKKLLERAAASDTPLLYLVYRSKFDLHAGQELQIDYGPAWERESRKYYFDMENFVEYSGPVPQLRRHVLAQEGLFPESWMSS